MRVLRSKTFVAAVSVCLCVLALSGVAFGADQEPRGLNETRTYKIQIYARTGGYIPDVSRPLTANGSIKANLTSTSGVRIRVCNAYGSVLSYPKACYRGTSTVFINTYGGQLMTRPEAQAIAANHSLGGTWTYRFP